jgi:FKBP-type peptidyl-prolyl cis-trans isomerase (trigger factor)
VSQYRELFAEQCGFRVRSWIALNQIVEQEDIELSDSDWEAWISVRVERLKKTRGEVEEMLELPQKEEHWRSVALREKVLNSVTESATYTAKKPEEEPKE